MKKSFLFFSILLAVFFVPSSTFGLGNTTTCQTTLSYYRACVYGGTACSTGWTESSLACSNNTAGETGKCCEKSTQTTSTGNPSSTTTSTSASFTYTPLEEIPGQGTTSDLSSYIKGLYSFSIFSVGIAALLMVIIGGFIYVTAAGNTSNVDKGKEYIKDAFFGILIAFGSYLILYVINPDLVNVDLSSLSKLAMVGGSGSSYTEQSTPVKGSGNGTCDPVPSGSCSVESLKSTCLASNAEAFSRLCNKESAGAVNSSSGVDICSNYGNASFSGGLFQINVFSNGSMLGDSRCNNLGSKGTCANRRASDGVCLGWNCQLTAGNANDLNYCMGLTKTADKNISVACQLSGNGVNTTPWACSANKCGLGGTSSSFCK